MPLILERQERERSLRTATVSLPFEQQAKESDKAFAAFSLYLSLGPQRSLEAVATKLGKSKTLMERWCRRHAWVARVQAQSEYLAGVEREKAYANLADIARMVEVASKMGRLASGMATDRTEVSGEDGGAIKVEFALALKKVYGQAEPVPAVIDVEAKPVETEKEMAAVGGSTN